MKLIRPSVMKDDFVIGPTMLQRISRCDESSIRAASIRLFGICMNACLSWKIPNVDTVLDMIRPVNVLRRFIFDRIIYDGIYVAATGSIYVAMMIPNRMFLDLNFMNTSAYARSADVITCKATITSEIHIVLNIYVGIGDDVMTLIRLSHVTVDGRKEEELITSDPGFRQLLIIHTNGNAVKAEIRVIRRIFIPPAAIETNSCL